MLQSGLFSFSSKQALIGNEHGSSVPKETIVQENGKVLTDIEESNHRAYGLLSEYYDNKSSRPLRLKKKLYEFYTAPITKFWANAVSYKRHFYLFTCRFSFLAAPLTALLFLPSR